MIFDELQILNKICFYEERKQKDPTPLGFYHCFYNRGGYCKCAFAKTYEKDKIKFCDRYTIKIIDGGGIHYKYLHADKIYWKP